MSERIIIHALWSACVMYCVAITAIAVVTMQRPPELAENATGKLVALFGPLITLLTVVFLRGRNGPPQEKKREDHTTDR